MESVFPLVHCVHTPAAALSLPWEQGDGPGRLGLSSTDSVAWRWSGFCLVQWTQVLPCLFPGDRGSLLGSREKWSPPTMTHHCVEGLVCLQPPPTPTLTHTI